MKAMMILISSLLFYAVPSHASELACWNLYAKYGASPVFTATVSGQNFLTDIRMLTNSGPFGDFDISDVVAESLGQEITSKHSPYRGGLDFSLTANEEIRIILPASLDADGLRNSFFKAGNLPENLMKRQNGVIEVEGSRHNSGGSIFIRMHCVSKN